MPTKTLRADQTPADLLRAAEHVLVTILHLSRLHFSPSFRLMFHFWQLRFPLSETQRRPRESKWLMGGERGTRTQT